MSICTAFEGIEISDKKKHNLWRFSNDIGSAQMPDVGDEYLSGGNERGADSAELDDEVICWGAQFFDVFPEIVAILVLMYSLQGF